MAHFFDGKDYHADTEFINKSKGVLPGMELKHMGFGEFYLEGPSGRVDFDRMRGKDFPGASGRSHKLYDDKGGKLVKDLVSRMEKAGKSKKVEAAVADRVFALAVAGKEKQAVSAALEAVGKAKTYPAAQKEILDYLESERWKVSKNLKIPHATHPDGTLRLWFKPRAVWYTYQMQGRHEFKYARTVSYEMDLRKHDGPSFVKYIEQWSSGSGLNRA